MSLNNSYVCQVTSVKICCADVYNSQINIVYYFHYIYILCVYSIVFVILNTT